MILTPIDFVLIHFWLYKVLKPSLLLMIMSIIIRDSFYFKLSNKFLKISNYPRKRIILVKILIQKIDILSI